MEKQRKTCKKQIPDLKRGKTGEKTTCEKTLFLQKLKALKRLLAGRENRTISQEKRREYKRKNRNRKKKKDKTAVAVAG